MRRFFTIIFAIALGLPLVAAGPSTTILPPPVLLVYPLTVNGGDVQKESGSRIAVIIAQSIANLGGVVVKPAPPGTERKDYLAVTRAQNAEYYLSGYVTPLGDGASVVEQLVSAQSGIVIYSGTAQIKTYNDADGQGDLIRTALLRHQARNIGAYEAPPVPAATPQATAAPGEGGAQANIGKLFGRKKSANKPAPLATAGATAAVRTTAAPAPAPIASATTRPTAAAALQTVARNVPGAYGVLAIGGSAEQERRDYARGVVQSTIAANKGRSTSFAVTAAELASKGQELCASANVGMVLGGSLATRSETTFGQPQNSAAFELTAYDCSGHLTYHRTFERDAGGDWKIAVDRAVTSAVGAFLHPAKGRS
ncbi:MAG: hypothetical protein NVSMB64_09890 [Candidatus Velthaea sp.]